MFFTGTLQEGISKALQEAKLVFCFVTDNGEESKTWEDEYLKDDTIAPLLEKDAVLLRLEAGSQEAGYLAALVPLPKSPTLVVIKNGELKEYISSDTSRVEFVRRVGGAFQAQAQAAGEGYAAPAPSSTTLSSVQQQPQQMTPTASATRSTEAREQTDRKSREEAEKRRREKGKMNEEDEQAQDPEKGKQTDAKKKAAQQLAERQRQAREERARVLKRIEDDKAERKARDEARRAERQVAAASSASENVEALTAAAGEPTPASTTRRPQHDQCAVQVRLLDGSTIRMRFPASATLATDVRPWVDETRADGKEPYTFKVILTPLPNRAVDPVSEEGRTLGELGLAPSSTLVLAPVGRYSPAYPRASAGMNNPVSRLIAVVLAFVASILGGIVGAFTGSRSSRRGIGGEQASGEQQDDRRDGASSSRINGFQNPDDRQRDYQLYNGNSVSLQPFSSPSGYIA